MSGNAHRAAAAGLLAIMFFLAGGAALHESATVDEIAHVGAGLSYLQRLDLRPERLPAEMQALVQKFQQQTQPDGKAGK